MPIDRFFYEGNLALDSEITLENKEDIHMRRVMRKEIGDTVEIFNGQGLLVEAQVKKSSLSITKKLKEEKRPKNRIIAQAITVSSKLDWLCEKVQELGATALWLYPADLSEKKTVNEALLLRLKTLALAACKQSGRLFLMEVLLKPPLSLWPAYEALYFGSTNPSAPVWAKVTTDQFCFVIGPEKGFSKEETKRLLEFEAKGVSLSPAILRTETAGLVALATHQFA